nr:SPOR domain-containing protein [Litorivivens lipolytica]
MRWAFVLLVLANLLYAGWNWQQQRAESLVEARQEQAAVPSLVLVDEMSAPPPVLVVDSGQAQTEDQKAAEPDTLAQQCWFVGEFADKARADRSVSVIQGMQLEARLDARDVPDEPDYWVHVGPFDSRERAVSVLQQLRGRKIDSFLIDEGELKNAISLGFFSQKRSAQRLMERYRNLEYSLRVHEVPRFLTHYDLYAFGRVDGEDIRLALQDRGLTAKPVKRDKKSCI